MGIKSLFFDKVEEEIPEEFTNVNEVLESLEQFYQEIEGLVINKNVTGEHSLKQL